MSLTSDQTIELNLLIRHNIITDNQIIAIKKHLQKEQSIMPLLINQYHINNEEIFNLFFSHFGINKIALSSNSFSDINKQSFQNQFVGAQHGIIMSGNDNIQIIGSCMSDINVIKSSMIHHSEVTCFLTDYQSICNIINTWQSHHAYTNKHINQSLTSEEKIEPTIHQLMDFLLTDAVIRHASDIHIQPALDQLVIRYRVDGVLSIRMQLHKTLSPTLINKIKLLAKMDISETRRPQDGRFSFTTAYKNNRDCRVNTCPSIYGEKAVLRILNPNQQSLSISQLDLDVDQLTLLQKATHSPQGLILITGPTGSGKTNTLYSLLNTINTPKKNIITIENPVELTLPGLHQINVSHHLSFGFNDALRACLRQDPDIIMIGEIRDEETAAIAIYAAQTGHLVFATLHANSTIDTITRLINMGIKPFNLTHSLILVLAQRLSRRLCKHCKVPGANDQEKHLSDPSLDFDQCFHASTGCEDCIDGYHQRLPILEILSLTSETKKILYKKNFNELLEDHLNKTNTPSLWQAGLKKISAGKTSLTELSRTVMTS